MEIKQSRPPRALGGLEALRGLEALGGLLDLEAGKLRHDCFLKQRGVLAAVGIASRAALSESMMKVEKGNYRKWKCRRMPACRGSALCSFLKNRLGEKF